MRRNPKPAPDTAREEAGKLIEQRARLKEWLARLEERGGDAAPHLVERVRGDYRERLRELGEQLAPFTAGIRQQLDSALEQLAAAEQAQGEAADAVGEANLRHLIGEIDEDAWTAKEPELQGTLENAQAETERLRAERDRLVELLAEIEGGEASEPEPAAAEAADDAGPLSPPDPDAPAGPAADEAVAVAEPPANGAREESGEPAEAAVPSDADEVTAEREAADGAQDELPWLALIDSVAADGSDEPTASIEEAILDAADEEGDERDFLQWVAGAEAADEEEDVAEANVHPRPGVVEMEEEFEFLEELDRALAGTAGEAPPRAVGNGRQRTAEASARGSLLCRECGSTNEARAWYCEICGAALA